MSGGLRSARWFGTQDVAGLIHRSYLKAEGYSQAAIQGRPIVGVCNSWSELVNCNVHFRGLAAAVKRGVLQAGGLPLEFPTISLGEQFMKPTTMLYRNLMAMDVEESIRANPLDAVVLIGGCDKTVPAQLMGAASADVPAIMITGGPAQPAVFRGEQISNGTDLWRYTDDLRAGRMTQAEYDELEAAMVPSAGHCQEMGTASTMASLVEAIGMALPGTASIPAVDARRAAAAEATGRRAVEMAHEGGPRPSQILTTAAFDNAITLLMALGGSTNAVLHLLALAGRVGVELELDRFDAISRRTPVLANVRPSGEHLVEDLFHAGGVPAVLHELAAAARRRRPDRHRRDPGREHRRRRRDVEPVGGLGAGIAALGRGRDRGAARLARPRRRPDQAQRGDARAAAPPRPGGRLRGRRRPGCADRRPRPRRRPPTRCSCCATAARRARPGCRSGASCRSRPSCCAPASRTWCGSRTRA